MMPSPAWSSPTLDVPSPTPLSVDDSHVSRSRGSSRSRSRVTPRNSNADTQSPAPATAPATLDTNTADNHLSPTSAAPAPPSPSSQPTTPLGSGSWLTRMFKKGKKEEGTVSSPATDQTAVDGGYRSIFATGQEYRAEQDVIALNPSALNTAVIDNHEINIDYESMVSGVVHAYGMEELERQHQTQSSMYFDQPIERKLDDDTRLLIYAAGENTPRITQQQQQPTKDEKFVPVNLSDRGTPSPSLSPWLATDVSQATAIQPPSVTRTRGGSRDVKNRKILKAVLPPSSSQPPVKRALPDVMPLSTTPSTNTSAKTSPRKSVGNTSPRKSVGFAPTANTKRTSVVNHRRRASSIGMDDHYDEVFDDVLADDEDDYEDVDVSEDHGMEDISEDDDDKENKYDENFAIAEARAFQVIQQQKMQQERELKQRRQKEYQEATKMWL